MPALVTQCRSKIRHCPGHGPLPVTRTRQGPGRRWNLKPGLPALLPSESAPAGHRRSPHIGTQAESRVPMAESPAMCHCRHSDSVSLRGSGGRLAGPGPGRRRIIGSLAALPPKSKGMLFILRRSGLNDYIESRRQP